MMDKFNLEDGLARLIEGLWPCTVDKNVFYGVGDYEILSAEARKNGYFPKPTLDYFNLMMAYALAGFEAKDGGWKAVFKPYVLKCVFDFGVNKTAEIKDIPDETVLALAPFMGMDEEICIDIPAVEEKPLPSISDRGTVVEGEETYWRLVKGGDE